MNEKKYFISMCRARRSKGADRISSSCSDVSGSMSGNAKKTQAMVATIISKLNPGDKLSLVTYSIE